MTLTGLTLGLFQPLASANAAAPAKAKKADRPAEKPIDRSATPFIPSEIEVKIENINDTRNGEVLHIKQVHRNEDPANQSDEALVVIGKSQYMIWKYLETEGIKHVFDESRSADINVPDSPSDPDELKLKERLGQIFPGGLPAKPTNYQLIILGVLGASVIYANFHSDVTIHAIATKEEAAALKVAEEADERQWGVFQKNTPWNDARSEILSFYASGQRYKMVQKYAANHIMDHLKHNKGARVALIFGAAHDFTQDFYWYEYNIRPRLTSVNFPGIVQEHNVFATDPLRTKAAPK